MKSNKDKERDYLLRVRKLEDKLKRNKSISKDIKRAEKVRQKVAAASITELSDEQIKIKQGDMSSLSEFIDSGETRSHKPVTWRRK